MPPISLDIVIPTHNRAVLLARTIESIHMASWPAGMKWRVVVVQNNCIDDTRAVLDRLVARFGETILAIEETRPGASHARNAGITQSEAELVTTIDDDEEIAPHWPSVVQREFSDPKLDFLSGTCIPNWRNVAPPDWLSPAIGGAVGWIIPSDTPFVYGENSHYILGGNSVFRRRRLIEAGLFASVLGKVGNTSDGGEDQELSQRLVQHGQYGKYCPDLLIKHHVFPDRLSRKYIRKQHILSGAISSSLSLDQEDWPKIFGIPRFLYANALRGALAYLGLTGGSPADRFRTELQLFTFIGWLYGRTSYRPSSRFKGETGPAQNSGASFS